MWGTTEKHQNNKDLQYNQVMNIDYLLVYWMQILLKEQLLGNLSKWLKVMIVTINFLAGKGVLLKI